MIDDFPYWEKSLISKEDMFSNLQSQELTVEEDFEGNKIVIRKYPEDYLTVDHISNHFTESIRIHCRFSNFPTPAEIWKQNKETIKNLSDMDQREYLYNSTRECNTFNDTYCLYIIKTLAPINAKILDPSAGWGNRLIAALAAKAKVYNGFDPNKLLQPAYKKIIKSFKQSVGTYNVKPIPFEDSILKHNYYDLALTSPPYFSLETYSTDNSQSVVKYPQFNEWITHFYKPYLIKMIDAVRKNGFVAIYVEDININYKKYNLREITNSIMNEKNEMEFYSKIGLKVGTKNRYTLIWKKK